MLCRVVAATTCAGEFTVAPSFGEETQTEPAGVDPGSGGGTGAGAGNGAVPVVGPCAITDCTVGQVLAFVGGGVGVGDGDGRGVGDGLGDGVGDEFVGGAGVGLLAVGVVGVGVLGLSPQPVNNETVATRRKESGARRCTRISTTITCNSGFVAI